MILENKFPSFLLFSGEITEDDLQSKIENLDSTERELIKGRIFYGKKMKHITGCLRKNFPVTPGTIIFT